MRMKTCLVLGLSLALQPVSFANGLDKHAPIDAAYLTIDSMQVEEVSSDEVATKIDQGALEMQSKQFQTLEQKNINAFDLLEKLKNGDIILDTIMNMGKKIWQVVEANKPVVNIAVDTANALPKGANEWNDLENWKAPVSKVYRVSYKNLYGATVAAFQYRVLYTPGGQVAGRGRYLTQVSVVPAEVQVSWGYHFNAQASVPSVTNAGSSKDPIGAAQILVKWTVDNVLKHFESSASYYIRGDGSFQDLSSGN